MPSQGERKVEWNLKAGGYQDKYWKYENDYKETDQLESAWSWLCSTVLV